MRKVLILLLVVGVLVTGTFSVIEELTEEMNEHTECAGGGSFAPPKSGGSTINGGDSGPIGGGGGAPG
jgi:hypothetical protein